MSGFVLCATFELVTQDKSIWTILQETGNSNDKVLVSQFRFVQGANARSDSPMTMFFKSPPAHFSIIQTALGRAVVSSLPPLPKLTSKRSTKNMAAKQSDYRIPIPDGDFDQSESLIAVQASLISYYRHLSPAGGFISLDSVALQLTKDTFCSAFHLSPTEPSGLADVVIPFQYKVQNALIALALLKLKKSDGKFDASTLAAVKQFQADFNRKSPTIRAICLSYPLKSSSQISVLTSTSPSSTHVTGHLDGTTSDPNSHHSNTPSSSDPSLQIRTDGAMEHRTASALFAYISELKSYLDAFGFPTPSDPLKTPKRFKAIFTAVRASIDIPTEYLNDGALVYLSTIPAFIDDCGLANKQSLESGKAVPEHLRDNVLKILQIASTFKPKEKRKSKRLSSGLPSGIGFPGLVTSDLVSPSSPASTPAPMASILPISATPISVPAGTPNPSSRTQPKSITSTSPSSNVGFMSTYTLGTSTNSTPTSKPIDILPLQATPYEVQDDSVFPSSPSSRGNMGSLKSSDSPRRAMTSPLLKSTPQPKESPKRATDPVADTYVVFDREYHESVPNWMSEIEIVDFSVNLAGYILYIDPMTSLSRSQPSSVVVRGDSNDIVSGMAFRMKSKPLGCPSLWDYYTRSSEVSASFERVRSVHGMLIVENLSDSQIVERKLVRCPDGLFNPHVSTVRIQTTLVKLGCQAKDFEYSISNPNLRSQDILYLKYKIDRTLPIDEALYQIVRNVQICLVALNCLPLSQFSPWYSNYVTDAVIKFEHDFEQAREPDSNKRLVWAAGNMTSLIYEELLNQTILFHKALIDLGFPVKCTPFEDIAQFYTYTLAYHETQKQLSEALNASPRIAASHQESLSAGASSSFPALATPARNGDKRDASDSVATLSSPRGSAATTQPSNASASANSVSVASTQALIPSKEPLTATSTAGKTTDVNRSSPSVPVPQQPLSPLMARHAPPELGQLQTSIFTPALPAPPSSSSSSSLSSAITPMGMSAASSATSVSSNPETPASVQQPLNPVSAPFAPRFPSHPQQPMHPLEPSDSHTQLSQDIEFGSSLASKYKSALQEHEELLSRYSALEESFMELSNDAADANTSLQFFEEQYKESVQNYDLLLREYESLKRTTLENEDVIQTLVQNVALLETKLQKLQRIAQRSFTTQLLWYLILTLLYILLLPALGVTFLIDLYRSKRQGIEVTDTNSLRTRLSSYSKHQLTKLEHVIDDLESKVNKWSGVETSSLPTKEKRN